MADLAQVIASRLRKIVKEKGVVAVANDLGLRSTVAVYNYMNGRLPEGKRLQMVMDYCDIVIEDANEGER